MRFFSWHHGNDWTKFERHIPPLHESMFSNAMFMDHLKSCVPQVQCLTLEHASELPGVLLKHRRMILGWGLKCEFAERFQVMLVRLVWRTHLQSHCPHYIISHFRNNLVGEVWQVQTRNDCKPQPGTDLLLSVVDISLSRATRPDPAGWHLGSSYTLRDHSLPLWENLNYNFWQRENEQVFSDLSQTFP